MEDAFGYTPPSEQHLAQSLRQQSIYNAMSATNGHGVTAEDLVAFAKRLVTYVATGE